MQYFVQYRDALERGTGTSWTHVSPPSMEGKFRYFQVNEATYYRLNAR